MEPLTGDLYGHVRCIVCSRAWDIHTEDCPRHAYRPRPGDQPVPAEVSRVIETNLREAQPAARP
jgi:hypothetical protein